MDSEQNLFVIAKIVGCFGIKGYVKIQPNTHSPERFSVLKNILIGRSSDTAVPLTVENVVSNQRNLLIKLEGVDTRSEAESFAGQFVFVTQKDVISPKEGSYFVHDILGCDVWSSSGRFLGRVEDIYPLPAQDVWVVRQDDREVLVPVVKEFIKSVDVAGRKIIINPIEGLIDE